MNLYTEAAGRLGNFYAVSGGVASEHVLVDFSVAEPSQLVVHEEAAESVLASPHFAISFLAVVQDAVGSEHVISTPFSEV